MRPILAAGVMTALALSTPAAQTPQSPMRPGRWEITTHMEMPGMPMTMPPQKIVQCITREQLEKGEAVPGAADEKNPCKMTNYKVSGNKITWNMACTGEQAMSGTGEIVVDGDTYTGTMKMTMDQQGTMTMKYTAKRIGDCEK